MLKSQVRQGLTSVTWAQQATGMWQSQLSLSGTGAGFVEWGSNEEMRKETVTEDNFFKKLVCEGG